MANAYKTDGNTPKIKIGWKLHVVLAGLISLAAMFFYIPLVMEHYIIGAIATLITIALNYILIYKLAEEVVRRSKLQAWEYRWIYSTHAAIVMAWWIAIILAEYTPSTWSWVKYSALHPTYLWLRASGYWGDASTVFGTLVALAAIKLAYHLATAHYRAEIARLTTEIADMKATAEARQKAQNDSRWQYGSTIADAVIALKHDRRSGDQAIGNVRRSLEKLLDVMYNGGVYPAALLHNAAEKYEAKEQERRGNPYTPPPPS